MVMIINFKDHLYQILNYCFCF